MPTEDFRLLKSFLEERPVAVRAAEPLKDGTLFQMNITGDDTPYYVIREAKRSVLKEGELPRSPDIIFTISPAAIKRLHDFDSNNIGAYGVEFFRIMVSEDPALSLEAKLNIGFFQAYAPRRVQDSRQGWTGSHGLSRLARSGQLESHRQGHQKTDGQRLILQASR